MTDICQYTLWPVSVAYDPDGELLFTVQIDGTVVGAESPSALFPDAWVNGNGFQIGTELGLATVIDLAGRLIWYPAFFDLDTGELLEEGEAIKEGLRGAGWHALPGGRSVVDIFDFTKGEQGPTVVYDPTDATSTELLGCTWLYAAAEEDGNHSCLDDDFSIPESDEMGTVYGHLVLSMDRSRLAAIGEYLNQGREWTIWDTTDFDVVGQGPQPDGGGFTLSFSDEWILTFTPSHVEAWDRSRGHLIWRSEPGDYRAQVPENGAEFDQRVEIDRETGMVALFGEDDSVTVVDTTTWEEWRIDPEFGQIREMAFHPNREQLTLFAEDLIEVVDIGTGISLHTIPIELPTDGYWLDEDHLLVGTGAGAWTIVTTSTEIARQRRPRPFTDNECALYGIDPCRAGD